MASFDRLTADLLKLITEKIADHADILRFSAVCKESRSVIMNNLHLLPPKLPLCRCCLSTKPRPLPLLMQCRDNEWENINFFSVLDGRNHGDFLVPEIGNKWVVGSCHGWLFVVDTQGRGIELLNPLTRAQIPLPSLDAFEHPKGGFTYGEFNDFGFVEKAIISSDPSSKRRNLGDNDDHIIATAIISNFGVLSFCRVGEDKWTNVEDSLMHIQDVIYYQRQIYAVNDLGVAVVCDFAGEQKMKQIASAPPMLTGERYLVESIHGDLLLVARFYDLRYDEDDEDDGDEGDEDEGDDDDEDDGDDDEWDADDGVMYRTTAFLVYKLEPLDEPVEPEGVFFITLNGIAERDHGLGHRNIARGKVADGLIDEDSICDMGIYDFEYERFQRFKKLNVRYQVPPIWISPNPL
ncbi:uncharacterized protein A4U43_C07F35730 [Asparagus officinalis]|uniref:KIB1-4 beta-propeller domain-containing protein n=1 Tax=Asparagus officinalis TaxID=4686 RepID=A0A5P1EHD3_ASPOF|nr:uncharacterized protein A4U43_C07F35730 [Asparagus officinalis]